MVRHGEIKSEQSDDGADQPLGLPQRQAKDRAQRQRCGDRQGRVVRLTRRFNAALYSAQSVARYRGLRM